MASAINTAAEAIANRFDTNWPDSNIAWEGADFDPPSTASWVRLTILWGDGNEMTYGGSGVGKNEIVGVVDIDLFAKPGEGTGAIEDDADTARDIFNRVKFSDLTFYVPSAPRRIGVDENGWLQYKVSCPFDLEETV